MTLHPGRIIFSAILLSGLLCSCKSTGDNGSRQALLDHHVKMDALDEINESRDAARNQATSNQIIARSDEEPATTRPEVIMPLGDPQPMVDEVGLAPDGPSKPYAPDPTDEVGLFPED